MELIYWYASGMRLRLSTAFSTLIFVELQIKGKKILRQKFKKGFY